MSIVKENPILFGCLGVLALMSLTACGAMLFLYLMADEIAEKGMEKLTELSVEAGKEAGLKDPMTTVPELLVEGWALSIATEAGSSTVEFGMEPMQPREVDCAILQAALFPYLTGTMETVVVTSSSRVVGEGGAVTTTPVECRWSGYPGSGGGLDEALSDDDDSGSDDDSAGASVR